MYFIFEVVDKSGRKIRLTKKQWSHIRLDHPKVTEEEITKTLEDPIRIGQSEEQDKWLYYKYFKHKKPKYLRVIVKYLNGDGFVITAYYVRNIK